MKQRFQRTTLITVSLGAFLGGLAMAYFGTQATLVLLIIAGLLALVSVIKLKRLILLSLIFFGAVLGCLRGQAVQRQLLPLKNLSGQKVSLTAQAATDAVYDEKSQLSFQADHMNFKEPLIFSPPGKITAGGFGATAIFRGDTVAIEGKFFASRGSNQGVMKYADLQVLSRNINPLDRFRLKFVAGLQTALPEPLASFGTGLLIGQRTTIPKEITDQLSTVGLTHIVAVSGYNLTIIVLAVVRLMRKRSKFQTIAVTLGLILLFVLLTGFSASIVRAAAVSILGLLAWYYGRSFKPLLLITLAAALTAGLNPLYLWGDIGWYLSFFAFFGILLLGPLIKTRFFGPKQMGILGLVVIETVSAQIMTEPLILYTFQQFSLVALLANVMVVPLVPLAMLLTLVAGLAGMLVPSMVGWLAWPSRIVLTYMLDMVHLMSAVPRALIHRSISLAGLLFVYMAIILVCWTLWRKNRDKSGIITDVI